MKQVADKLPAARKEKFVAEAPAAVKELLGRFSELQFFTGENMDLEGSLAYAYYKEVRARARARARGLMRNELGKGTTHKLTLSCFCCFPPGLQGSSEPTFLFFKDSLKEVKC